MNTADALDMVRVADMLARRDVSLRVEVRADKSAYLAVYVDAHVPWWKFWRR